MRVGLAWGSVFACALLLPGCGMLEDAKGPSPKIDASDLRTSTTNELQTVETLLIRAGLVAYDTKPVLAVETVDLGQPKVVEAAAPAAQPVRIVRPDLGDDRWYYIVPAGFNYIDEKCNIYMRALYDLDRNRDRFKSALLVLDKSSNAIMGVAGASSKVMQVTAQAFGLSSGVTDAFVDRYEFKVEPTIVFLTLDKLRSKYREEIAKRKASIKSPAEALVVLRTYLNICQPNSIEAVVNNYVAQGVADSNGGGGRSGLQRRIDARKEQLAALLKSGPPAGGSDEAKKVTKLKAKIKELEDEQAARWSSGGSSDAAGVRVFLTQ